jgi:hypothetical protein
MSYRGGMKWSDIAGVGATGVKKTADDALDTSDAVIRELDIPIMSQALQLQSVIFTIADELGVGDEVRTLVKGIREFEYAGIVAANYLPAGTAAAVGGAALSSIGAFGALGAVGVIGVALVSLFGGEDEEANKAVERVEMARRQLTDVLERKSLQGLADEQAVLAFRLERRAQFSTNARVQADLKTAQTARRLERFYVESQKKLSPAERDLFTSLSNLGRWEKTLDAFAKLDNEGRYHVNLIVPGKKSIDADKKAGRKVTGYADMLAWRIAKETAAIKVKRAVVKTAAGPKIVLSLDAPAENARGTLLALAGLGVGLGYYLFK